MVYRIFVEKKPGLANEAASILSEIKNLLKIETVTGVRILNRYDVENITEELFDYACKTVFSEPQLDITTAKLSVNEADTVFYTEYLPGQFDMRADSAAQCIQIISKGDRPTVRTAKVYVLEGSVTEEDLAKIKKHVINPVEAREATEAKPATLALDCEIPTEVATLTGFLALDEYLYNEYSKLLCE